MSNRAKHNFYFGLLKCFFGGGGGVNVAAVFKSFTKFYIVLTLTLTAVGSGFSTTILRATGAAYPGPPCADRKDLESIDILPIRPPGFRKLGTIETFFFPSFCNKSAH